MIIQGTSPEKGHQGTCFSYDDHRIAMTLAVAGMAGQGVEIENPDCIDISYPSFYEEMHRLYK